MKIKVNKNELDNRTTLFRCLVTRVMYVAASSEVEAAALAHSEDGNNEEEILPEVDVTPATKEQASADGWLGGVPYGNGGGRTVKEFLSVKRTK